MTSENVAERYGITRAQQDEMAARSHRRAAAAQASGRFADEIVPVKTMWKDPKTVRGSRSSLPAVLLTAVTGVHALLGVMVMNCASTGRCNPWQRMLQEHVAVFTVAAS